MQTRCMLCGRMFEPDYTEFGDSEEDDLFTPPDKKKKSTSICPMCRAKIHGEADKSMKPQKPM